MKKMGIEIEYFVTDELQKDYGALDKLIIPSDFDLPMDESGILGEMRIPPRDNPVSLYFAYLEEKYKIFKLAKEKNVFPIVDYANTILSKEMKNKLNRRFEKGIIAHHNLYNDFRAHGKSKNKIYAGTHIHFSRGRNERYFIDNTYKIAADIFIPEQLDIPNIVKNLDNKFAKLIDEQGRNKGCYELKPWGFEYRSLPSFIILDDKEILPILEFAWELF